MTEVVKSKVPSQRTLMRALARQFGYDRSLTCKAFAEAERDGKVTRGRNARNSAPEVYANALWGDGERKGWLRKSD